MSEKLLIGVDIGTNSSKGVLVTLEGKILAQHVVAHDMDVPRPGWAETAPRPYSRERCRQGAAGPQCRLMLEATRIIEHEIQG
jgi:sugar (pentulose or hexulose) kinase